MEQLSFFSSVDSYWRLVGNTSEDKFYLHELCGYTFPFSRIGYRPLKICPCCSTSMISFYYVNNGGFL